VVRRCCGGWQRERDSESEEEESEAGEPVVGKVGTEVEGSRGLGFNFIFGKNMEA